MKLKVSSDEWLEIPINPVNTLQIFITNNCNFRCQGCFFRHRLGKGNMALNDYCSSVINYAGQIKKVILLGGEPTLHPNLIEMIAFNNSLDLRTTIYTNGFQVDRLILADLSKTSIRWDPKDPSNLISNKHIFNQFNKYGCTVTLVFMMRKDNSEEILKVASLAEDFGCKKFFISSMRDINSTGSFWIDGENDISLSGYAGKVQDFLNVYKGGMEIHISRRGVLELENGSNHNVGCCRFGNILTNGDTVVCPFDICKIDLDENLKKDEFFVDRRCLKNNCSCLLQKIVLKRRI